MRKAIGSIIILTILLTSSVLSVLFSVADSELNSAPRQFWEPGLTINYIILNHTLDEPTEYNEYKNNTREVIISVKNTGEVVLKDIVIDYKVTRGTTTHLSGTDSSMTKLNIGVEYLSKFDWTPVLGEGLMYFIEATVSADNFGQDYGPVKKTEAFVINDVKFDVGPTNYELDTVPAVETGEYTNQSHFVTAIVKNYGNFQISSSFWVEATIYDAMNNSQLWSDTKLFSSSITANDYGKITFDLPWQPTDSDFYIINLSSSLGSDDKPGNDNSTSFLIEIQDVKDASVININNFVHAGSYHCSPFTVITQIINTGNINITTAFSATLSINSYPDGAPLFVAPPVPVPVTGVKNISAPGSIMNLTFAAWGFADGLKEGLVWLNISIDPVEMNGSSMNNNFSIMIQLTNSTSVALEFMSPRTGIYYTNDLNSIQLRVTNTGTNDLPPYQINISVLNRDSEELWPDHYNRTENNALVVNDARTYTFTGWEFNYNARFKLSAGLALLSDMQTNISDRDLEFKLDGGRENATVSGVVVDYDGTTELQDIQVEIFRNSYDPVPINSTLTDATGKFSFELVASPEGSQYFVTISQEFNYWWFKQNVKLDLKSDRDEDVKIVLTRRPTGTLTGSVMLKGLASAPQPTTDWSKLELAVEDTPITFGADASGNFDIELVAGVINLSATMENYKHERVEYVTIPANDQGNLEFSMMEEWAVEVSPENNENAVETETSILAKFDSKVDMTTVNFKTLRLLDEDDKLFFGITNDDYKPFNTNKSVRLLLNNKLAHNATYKIVISTDLKKEDGTPALHRDWTTNFTTVDGFGTVAGRVSYFWSKRPIEDVEVSLVERPQVSTKTDANGMYILDNIQFGDYQLKFVHEGYQPKIQDVSIIPDLVLWANISFDDEVPIPKLLGFNRFDRKIAITDTITDTIKISTNFTLTSSRSLDAATVNANTVKILNLDTGLPVGYSSITPDDNLLNFEFDPSSDLKYETRYQVILGKDISTAEGHELFTKDHTLTNFTTEQRAFWPLTSVSVTPENNAVNIPINISVRIDFPVTMEHVSVETAINASFEITKFVWSEDNLTLNIEHKEFNHSTIYRISLIPGMVSQNNNYKSISFINISFTTIPGLIKYIIGPFEDTDGNPVENASVAIYNSDGNLLKSSPTDDSGFATFYFDSALPPGNYSLQILKPGYKRATGDVQIQPDGEVVSELPELKKRESISDDYELFMVAVIVVVLVIILVVGLLLMVFKLKVFSKAQTQAGLGEVGGTGKDKKEVVEWEISKEEAKAGTKKPKPSMKQMEKELNNHNHDEDEE